MRAVGDDRLVGGALDVDLGEGAVHDRVVPVDEAPDVGAAFFAPSGYVGTADLDAEEGRADKRGFAKGKRYFIYEVAYRGPEELRLQASELSDCAWVAPRFDDLRLLKMLSGIRPGKCRLIVGALVRILP